MASPEDERMRSVSTKGNNFSTWFKSAYPKLRTRIITNEYNVMIVNLSNSMDIYIYIGIKIYGENV